MRAEVLEKPATIEDVYREVSKLRSTLTDAVEDAVRSVRQAVKHGRYAAEDIIEEAEHTVRQKPLRSMAAAFAVGILAGGFLGWVGFRRR